MNYIIKYEEELIKIAKELEKIDTIDKISELVKEQTIILIRESLERLDEKLFQDRRRKNEYESKKKDERTIVTLQGVIRYKRRRYKDKSTGRSIYLLDVLIGVMKRKRYSEEVMKKADYVIKNDFCTQGWYKNNYLGCNMEMVMSHYICDRFKGSPKI